MSAEMRLLREFGEDRKPRTGEPLARLRQRLSEGEAPPTASGRTPVPARRGWLPWRPLWTLGAAAASVALVAAIVGGGGSGPDGRPDAVASGPTGTTAARILTLAAQQSVAQPDPVARPDQFVFVESVRTYLTVRDNTVVSVQAPVLRQEWRPIDGKQDGLFRERKQLSSVQDWFVGTVPRRTAGFPAGLPTDAEAMLRYLYRPDGSPGVDDVSGGAAPLSADQKAFWRAMLVLDQAAGSPGVQAAVFEATAKLPGVTVIPHATDASGRDGVAVALVDRASRMELVFDQHSYAYLGTSRVFPDGTSFPLVPTGASSFYSTAQQAVLRVAIVDHAGQLP